MYISRLDMLGVTSLRSVKLYGKKKKKREFEIVCSFNGISITCRLEMGFFYTMRNNCCVMFT